MQANFRASKQAPHLQRQPVVVLVATTPRPHIKRKNEDPQLPPSRRQNASPVKTGDPLHGHYVEKSRKHFYAISVQLLHINIQPRSFQCMQSIFCMVSRQMSYPENIRKVLVSVKFLSAILGPEKAAPILWTPRISAFFLQEKNLHVHKIPRCSGGFWVGGGRGSADFIFMGAEIFLM